VKSDICEKSCEKKRTFAFCRKASPASHLGLFDFPTNSTLSENLNTEHDQLRSQRRQEANTNSPGSQSPNRTSHMVGQPPPLHLLPHNIRPKKRQLPTHPLEEQFEEMVKQIRSGIGRSVRVEKMFRSRSRRNVVGGMDIGRM
jgi:hypothetical protein